MKTGKCITRGLVLIICLINFAIPALAQDYDLFINNCRVMDKENVYYKNLRANEKKKSI